MIKIQRMFPFKKIQIRCALAHLGTLENVFSRVARKNIEVFSIIFSIFLANSEIIVSLILKWAR